MSKFVKLSSIAELTVGFVGTMAKHYEDEGIPFLRSLNIKPFKIISDDMKYVSAEFSNSLSKSILHKGDVVIVRTGIPGTCCVVPAEYDGCNCSDVVIVHPNTELVNPHYLAAYINFWGQRQIQNNKVGAIQQHFNVHSAEEMLIFLPDITEQEKIAKTIVALNEKIENNTSVCAKLESMAKMLYDYWFTQFDFPDENGKPYRSSGGEMVWNDQLKREIPKGWGNCKLKDYANSVTRSTSPGEHLKDLFYTPIDEIPRRQMSFWGGLPYTEANSSLQLYQENDILIGAMRVYFHRVCIAAQRGITRSTTMVLQARNTDDLAFIYELFNHDQTIQYANKISVGTQQPYVNWDGALDSMDVIAPEHSVIAAFCEHINPIIEKVKCLARENRELTKLRDWLLPMLMNGQATVE